MVQRRAERRVLDQRVGHQRRGDAVGEHRPEHVEAVAGLLVAGLGDVPWRETTVTAPAGC